MELFGVLSLAVIGAALAVLVRSVRPEMGLVVGVVTGLIVLLYALGEITGVLASLRELAAAYGVDGGYIGVLLKILGIAYAAQFGAQICADAGESAIAGKVELCGRVLILAAALPVVITTLGTAMGLLRSLP